MEKLLQATLNILRAQGNPYSTDVKRTIPDKTFNLLEKPQSTSDLVQSPPIQVQAHSTDI